MNTRQYYEEQINFAIKDIPDYSLEEFLKYIGIFKNLLNNQHKTNSGNDDAMELCGIWDDDRDVEEIIKEMESGRNYFSNREIIFDDTKLEN
jgi:hypothetical protein